MVLGEHPGLMVGLGPHGWAGGLRALILLRKHKVGKEKYIVPPRGNRAN